MEIPSSVNVGRALSYALLTVLLGACAAHVRGLVEPAGAGARLTTVDGRVYKLILTGGAVPIRALGGHLIDVQGPRLANAIRVGTWSVGDGLHGMPTWVGKLVVMGDRVGIQDINSGALYFVDEKAGDLLRASDDQVVLLEGYVDGPHTVKVLYYRVLD